MPVSAKVTPVRINVIIIVVLSQVNEIIVYREIVYRKPVQFVQALYSVNTCQGGYLEEHSLG